jgi:hypothetical protein
MTSNTKLYGRNAGCPGGLSSKIGSRSGVIAHSAARTIAANPPHLIRPNDILLVPLKLRLQRTMPVGTSRGITQMSDFRLRTSYATTNVRNLILFYLSDVLLHRDRGAFNIRLTFV